MLKFKVSLLSMVLVLALLPTMAFAQKEGEPTLPKQVITSYLKAIEDRNVDAIMGLVVDQRYFSPEEQKHSYTNMLKYKRNQITKANIEREISASNGDVTYVVEMTSNDGSIESSPFTVKKVDGQWKIVIEAGKDSNKDPLHVIKKQATEQEDVQADVQLSPAPTNGAAFSTNAQLMNYNFWQRLEGTKFYSIQTFDFSQNQLTLNYRQWCDSNLGRIITTNITYAVVIERWGSDTFWGEVQVVENNQNTGHQVTISGNNNGLNGAKLRFIIPTYSRPDEGQVSFAGFGELYS